MHPPHEATFVKAEEYITAALTCHTGFKETFFDVVFDVCPQDPSVPPVVDLLQGPISFLNYGQAEIIYVVLANAT